MRYIIVVLLVLQVIFLIQGCSNRMTDVIAEREFQVWYSTVQIRGNEKANYELDVICKTLKNNGIEFREEGHPSSSVITISLVDKGQSAKAIEVLRTVLPTHDPALRCNW